MNAFLFATNTGIFEFVFASSEQRATQIFLLELVIGDAPPSRFVCRKLDVDRVIEAHRDQLREAILIDVEGVGVFDAAVGWRIFPPGERPDDV